MKTLLPVMVGVALALASAAGSAEETDKDVLKLSIERKSLRDALNDWAQQTGYQLIAEIKGEFVAPKIEGRLTAQEALERLLQGTPLTYQWMGERLVAVKEKPLVVPAALQTTQGDSRQQSLPIARFSGEGWTGQRLAANDQGPTRGDEPAGPGRSARGARDVEELEEVVVTGTHIRGITPESSPVIIYDRSDIDASGATSLQQFARERMPENFASVDAGTRAATSAGGFGQGGGNRSYGAGFNLHGLGPGSTLTLVNGRRLSSGGTNGEFVDISLIPLRAVKRIEVLSDGASALYGADAVAGVVNIQLRDDFEGAETSLTYGEASRGGATEFSGSQLLGHAWNSGSAMLVYEFSKQNTLLASQRSFIPPQNGTFTVLPEQERNSALLNARQQIGDRTTITADAIFSEREFSLANTVPYTVAVDGKAKLYGGGLSLAQALNDDWRVVLIGNYSTIYQPEDNTTPSFSDPAAQSVEYIRTDTERSGVELRADGSIFALPAGDAKVAVGASFGAERLVSESSFVDAGFILSTNREVLKRDVTSAYAEMFLPILGSSDSRTSRLELSLAGRFDDYDDFGSSTNPKVGVLWSPLPGLNLRSTWGTSFRPPLLPDLIDRPLYLNFDLVDPSAPDGITTTLMNQTRGNPALDPEESESFTVGFDWRPESQPTASLSLTYFDIHFEDRVATPPYIGSVFDIYTQTGALAPFFDFSPDPAQIEALFDSGVVIDTTGGGAASVEATFDLRPANIAAMDQSGLDLSASYQWQTAAGEFTVGLAASHLLENEYNAVSSAPTVSLLDLIGQPVDTRLSGLVSWSRGAFQATLSASHWASYRNTLTTPASDIDSWTTTDLQLRYRGGEANGPSMLSGLGVAILVRNLADEAPPRVITPIEFGTIGYDPTNASALGRFITVSLTWTW